MNVTKVAKRYASALFQEAKSRKALDAVAADMRGIRESISGSRDLELFLKSQIISRRLKRDTLHKLFDEGLGKITRQFMELILEKRREDQLPGIAEAFEKIYKKEQGIVDVEVSVITKPDSKQREQLRKALEKKINSSVNLMYIEDPSLKGGMAVRIEDTVIDGTVKHKLQQLETAFLQAGV